jgi:putative flippase GtrA
MIGQERADAALSKLARAPSTAPELRLVPGTRLRLKPPRDHRRESDARLQYSGSPTCRANRGMSNWREFFGFVAIGGFATGVNFVARIVIDIWTSFEVAIVLAYLVGMAVAFLLYRTYVFQASDGSLRRQSGRFVLVSLGAFVQVFLISVGLERFLLPAIGFTWHADAIAHGVALASLVVTSYLGHKRYSFATATP